MVFIYLVSGIWKAKSFIVDDKFSHKCEGWSSHLTSLKCSIAFCCLFEVNPGIEIYLIHSRASSKEKCKRLKAISTWMATRMCEKVINLFQSKHFVRIIFLCCSRVNWKQWIYKLHFSQCCVDFIFQYLFRGVEGFLCRLFFGAFREGLAKGEKTEKERPIFITGIY